MRLPPPSTPAAPWVAALWTLAVLGVLLVPFWLVPDIDLTLLEPAAHLVLFAGFTALWIRAFPDARGRVVAVSAALALLTEAAQWLLPIDRGAELVDLGLDAVGIAVGVGLAALFRVRRRSGD